MSTPLLSTKLYIPPVRPELVPRPHLIDRLNAGLDRKLTVISAPAGFGKTTLLSEWASSCRRPVAWVSLDEADNDPVRFLGYLVAALQTVEQGVGEGAPSALQSRHMKLESVLTALVNDLAAVPSPLVCVLDDYHHMKTQRVHDTLTFLLDHLPPQFHLVVSGRSDPPLPVALLRGRGQVSELRQADLRFSAEEATTFLNQVMGLGLSTDQVDALADRTEGWIAGLQMAAVSMQGRDDPEGFVRAFTGSNRYILDYLLEEVLQRQSEGIQDFLLHTSILGRLTGPLCDALTGHDDASAEILPAQGEGLIGDGQATLEMLGGSNLFIVPLDDQRSWYRYHHLFADLLRQRLHQTHPELPPRLHRRASEWYEHNGLIAPAIDHALAAADFERAADLIEQTAETALIRGEFDSVLGWLEALPDDTFRNRPLLCIYHAAALFVAAAPLSTVESILHDAEESDKESLLKGETTALRAMLAMFEEDMPESIRLSRQALELLPEDSLLCRSFTARNLGTAYLLTGDVTAASRVFEEETRICEKTGDRMGVVAARQRLAVLLAIQGRLREAKALNERAIELALDEKGQTLPFAIKAFFGLADVLRERNDLEDATRVLREGLQLSRRWTDVWGMGGQMILARVRQAQGDLDGALQAMQRAEELAIGYDSSDMDDIIIWAYQARLRLAHGELEAASQWMEKRGLGRQIGATSQRESITEIPAYHLHEIEQATLARVYLAQSKPDEALKILEPLLMGAESLGRKGSLIEVLALQALAFQAQGDVERALSALERALSLAEPEGYVRVFLDEGEPMVRLLRQAASRGVAPGYASRLLAATPAAQEAGIRKPVSPPQPLVEPLSERELEVLRLLTSSLASTEIAEELIISVNTVRSHIRSIYGKLGVHSRYEAVARAKELNLL